jgi:uncharacterized protein YndB with AHSA1/START domain
VEVPSWLAPLSGVLAIGAGFGLVGLWLWGESLPEEHTATIRARIPADSDRVWALVSDPTRRPEWVEHVVKVVEGEVDGVHAWRQVDPGGDRFDFRVVEADRPVLVIATARTEDLGMEARWTWTVEPADGATDVTLTEVGAVTNPLFRAMWRLRRGPYVVIESDLRSLSAALGAPGIVPERVL